jgi:hypothetical protein
MNGARRESEPNGSWPSENDFTGYPPPITGFHKNRPPTQLRARTAPIRDELLPLPTFREIKRDDAIFHKAEDYLRTYGDNRRRKVAQIHQNWEDRYMQPLHGRMRHKMNGRAYSDFRAARTRTLSELESKNGGPPSGLGSGPLYNALEDEDAVSAPYVKIAPNGLDDRMHKSQKHARNEES